MAFIFIIKAIINYLIEKHLNMQENQNTLLLLTKQNAKRKLKNNN